MRTIYKRGAIVGALSGALLLAAGQSALAAPTTSPEGIGLYASGTLATVSNTPDVTTSSSTPTCVASVAAGILTAQNVCAQVNGNQTTTSTTGETALGATAITAGAITSSCIAGPNGFTLASNVAGLTIAGVSYADANATPNDTITIPLIGSIEFNEQIPAETGSTAVAPGSQTVNALVLNIAGEKVVIGSSTCGPYNASAPVAGGKGLVIGLGALAVGGAGVAGVRLNRRRRLAGA